MMRLYLAGPINGTTDNQAFAWRDTVTSALAGRVECVSPMVRDYRGKESENVAAIVEGDLADIASCDVVLAYCWQPSYGTAMEIRAAAHELKKPVHVVCAPPVSPWLAYHATVHATLGDAVLAIARLAEASA